MGDAMFDLFSDFAAKPLRPHQQTAIDMVRHSLGTGHKHPVLQLATGAGKSRIAAEIINMALAKGNQVAFTVPAISLIDQSVKEFADVGIHRVNVMQGNHPRKDPMARVHIISVQSLLNRDRPKVGLVIVDECHIRHRAILDWMQDEPKLPFVGLSATPWARGMADHWDDLLRPVTMQALIDAGYLSPFRVFAPSHPDLTTVRTKAGDYHEGDLSSVMSDNRLVADVVTTWKQRAAGLPTLVFAVDRAHAEKLQAQFAAAGVAMGYCDANVDRVQRKMLFDQLAAGKIAGICNVGTLTTGVDADIRCVVLARPTKSEMLFCLDSETEILTSRGWKSKGEIAVGDVVASCADGDRTKGCWSRVTGVVQRPMSPDERWVSYEAPRANFRVTDRHRLIAGKSPDDMRFVEAAEVVDWKGSAYLPTAVHIHQPGVPLSDDELYLIGILMTDGTWTNVAAQISQSERHPEIIERIERALQNCGISYRKSPITAPVGADIPERHKRWRFNLSAGSPKPKVGIGRFAPTPGSVKFDGVRGFRHLLPFLDKDLAPALMALSRSQFEVLLDGIWDGDGFKKKNVDYTPQSRTVCTARRVEAERLQALGAINGYTVHFREEIGGRENPIYLMSFTPKDWRSCGGYSAQGRNQRPKIDFSPATSEEVWCVECEHGAIVTRRKGKVTVMGNCQMIGRGLRTAPGKSHALVLDHADNHARLGFVTDIHHSRLLAGSEKTPPTAREKGEATPKDCPKCGALRKGRECIACGFVAARQSEVEPEPGELVEVKARKPKVAMVDKQAFWSMAQHVDAERGKGGKLALALYKAKFGVWPRGLDDTRRQPDAEFLSYERSRRIARSFAKRRAAA